MAYKNEKDCFTPSKHSRVCTEHFTEDSLEQILAVKSFVGTLFKLHLTCTPERRGTDDFNYLMESCKPGRQLDKKKNKIKKKNKQANNIRRFPGELLTCLYLDPKSSQERLTNSRTQQYSR